MTDPDDPLRKGRAPRDETEWRYLWDNAHRMSRLWPLAKPLVALKENWAALCIVAVVVIWVNSEGVIALIQRIAGNFQ